MTRDYSRVSVKSLTRGLCDIIAAVIQQETRPPYTSCLANQRERDQTHTAHTTACTKQRNLNNCNVYMSQVVHHSVKNFLTQFYSNQLIYILKKGTGYKYHLFYEEKDFIEFFCVQDYSAVPSVGRTIEAALQCRRVWHE